MVEDLSVYGLVPKKARIADPQINLIPKELLHHFWRGVIDGDGTIIVDNQNQWQISLIGAEGTVIKFRDTINKFIGKDSGCLCKDGNCFRVYFKQIRICKQIISYLYRDATIYLLRKKESADKLLLREPLPCFSKDVTKEELLEAKEECRAWYKVATKFNISVSQLLLVRKNLGITVRKGKFSGIKDKPFYRRQNKGKFVWGQK
jgi:hypothetical protein